MTTYAYDVAAIIGRLQGATRGHAGVLRAALIRAEKIVLFLGSANLSRDTRNPWNFSERHDMVVGMLRDMAKEDHSTPEAAKQQFAEWLDRIHIVPLNDTGPFGKNEWITQVQIGVRGATTALRPRVVLVGNIRDNTSEYLTWFPRWDFHAAPDTGINATSVRRAYFSGSVDFGKSNWSDNGIDWDAVLHPSVIRFLERFRDRPEYAYLMRQKAAEDKYKADWGNGPFLTVDAVIECAGHVARITRGGEEGFGMKALPGGFANAGESLLQGALREAVEETAIFIAPKDRPALKAWLKACGEARKHKLPPPETPAFFLAAMAELAKHHVGEPQIFDDPHRSRRAHLITTAYHFVVPPPPIGHDLPEIEGCDDAAAAHWDPISEIDPGDSFEDHAWIVDRMLNLNA